MKAAGGLLQGSSPLTRGKHRRRRRGPQRPGLIPAHTGKTIFRLRARASRPAYPHLRRENSWDATAIAVSFGSPPHIRGKRPARAGKTALAASLTRIRRAHPRSRGEDPQSFLAKIAVMGSSPLMREKPRGEGTPCVPEGLIHAHAGKTLLFVLRRMLTGAHPRSRGENWSHDGGFHGFDGSSPLTRGKTSPRNCGRGVGRFIPADRGKLICIDDVHVANWKTPECTGATSPPHSTPARGNHTLRSSTRHTCALMAEPMSSSRSRMPCPDQFH